MRLENMNQLHCVNIMSISIIGVLFFYIGVVGVTGQSGVTPTSANSAITHNANDKIAIKVHNKACECIEYNCGCCQYVEWNVIHLNGTLCVNASYLEHDYGISLTVTFNNFSIYNNTVTARNPPPICLGEDIVNAVEVEVCLHIYDIDVDRDKFHACFEILGEIMKLQISKIKLGCVGTKSCEKIIKNNINSHLPISYTYPEDRNVIMV